MDHRQSPRPSGSGQIFSHIFSSLTAATCRGCRDATRSNLVPGPRLAVQKFSYHNSHLLQRSSTAAVIHCDGTHCDGHPMQRPSTATVIYCDGQVIHCGGHPLRRSSTAAVIYCCGHLLRRSSTAAVIYCCGHLLLRSSTAAVIHCGSYPLQQSNQLLQQ